MEYNLPADKIAETFLNAIKNDFFIKDDTLAIFIDLDHIEERFKILRSTFPENSLHAIAIKADPLEKILVRLNGFGAGAEAATYGELLMALNAGYPPEKIVYDSPVKTVTELESAISQGVHINIDSFAELERIKEIRKRIHAAGTFGLRINPQVGAGSIATSSVAGDYSKFGIPVRYRRQEIIDAFISNDWLTGIHLHIGSQGCSPEMLVNGEAIVFDLVREINKKAGRKQINIFDTGGGFPISYSKNKQPYQIEEYAGMLKKEMPELFSTDFKIITEFGRWLHVNAGWTVSRIEYVKDDGGIKTAMIHAGADLFLRECLLPSDWQHEYTLLDKDGNIKKGSAYAYNLAGPLCFSGDILAKNVELPKVEEGDFIVIHDTGGYTFSMWSRYNSRFFPQITGYKKDSFEILRKKEDAEELIRFWR